MEWGFIFAGLLVGLMVGITGVGGGSLMTPILIFGFAVPPVIAVGTDLLFAAITKAGGVWSYWWHNAINWSVVKCLAIGSVPMTLLTLLLLSVTGISEGEHTQLITSALGFALILTSTALLLKDWLRGIIQAQADHPVITTLYKIRQDEQHKAIITIVIGGLLGVMVTLSSVGAGALGAVTLLFLYPRMKGIEVVATDIAHAVPLTAIAGLGHATVGTVDWSLLTYLLLGSLPGIYLGSHLGVKIPDQLIRHLLAVLLLAVGIKCLW